MWTTIGHVAARSALQRALSGERPSQAYAFIGPQSVGKARMAREFAAALNCESGEPPCGECRPCRDTLAGRHPDVEMIAPGGMCDEPEHRDHPDARDLRICQVRRLERVLSLSPYMARRRVAIIDAADTLRTEAANAFLKTLEEPPAETVIVLLIEREERLPETVLSRCQKVYFHRIDRETMAESLVQRGAEPDLAAAIVAAAEGRLGWALSALTDPSMLAQRSAVLDDAVRLAHASRSERFTWARLAESRDADARERARLELRLWESWWRDVLAAASGAQGGFLNQDRAPILLTEGKLYEIAEIVVFLRTLLRTREYLEVNVDPQLALENLTLDLPSPRMARQLSR